MVVVVVIVLLQQRLWHQQLKSNITKAIISPVVRDSLLSLSKTAYNSNKYSKLVVIFIKIPFVFTNVVFLLQYAPKCAKVQIVEF